MAVRRLDPDEESAFVARHKITAAQVPSYGLRIVENNRDYLVGVQSATGRIGVWDITVIDPETGLRLDPGALWAGQVWTAGLNALYRVTRFVADIPKAGLKYAAETAEPILPWGGMQTLTSGLLVLGAGWLAWQILASAKK